MLLGFEPPRRKDDLSGARRVDFSSIDLPPGVVDVSYRLEEKSNEGPTHIASDFSAVPLVLSVGDDGPWTHLSRDGVVYRSDSRAGALRVLEQVPPTISLAAVGPTVFGLGGDGVVWSLADEAAAPVPVREGVRLMAADGDALLVVDGKGQPFASAGGTGPFEPLDVGGCVTELRYGVQGLTLTVGGRRMRRSQGAMAPLDREDPVGMDRRFRQHFWPQLRLANATRLADRTLVGFADRRVLDLSTGEGLFEVPESCGLEVLVSSPSPTTRTNWSWRAGP